MKLNKHLFFVLIVAALANACGSDESSPKIQFSADGETITLKGANLYLTNESTNNGTHRYRDYFITDGTYTEC